MIYDRDYVALAMEKAEALGYVAPEKENSKPSGIVKELSEECNVDTTSTNIMPQTKTIKKQNRQGV